MTVDSYAIFARLFFPPNWRVDFYCRFPEGRLQMDCLPSHKSCTPKKRAHLTTHKHTQIPCKCQRPWPPPLPHMNTFPWSYGRHITPIERKSPLLHSDTTAVFFSGLVLRRRPTYAITNITHKITNNTVITMAAADAPFHHLPMERWPQY